MVKKVDVFKLPVLKEADIFPMLDEDDLKALSEDIKENGLREPLVLAKVNKKTVLVDGRNRREACKLAKIDPDYVYLDEDENPAAYVISANIHRRHMTKSQRAMAVAMVYPESTNKGGRGKTCGKFPQVYRFDRTMLSDARTILRQAPDLARKVLSGIIPIYKASEELEERSEEEEDDTERLRKLKKRYSDLADLVSNDEMTIEEAEKEASNRDEEQKQIMLTFFDLLKSIIEGAAGFAHNEAFSDAMELFNNKSIRDKFESRYRGGPEDFEKDRKLLEKGINNVTKLLEDFWE